MLQVVTQTALLRRWPPQLYVRLCNQLQDNPEQSRGSVEELVEAVESPHIPLLYEYILQLSLDSKSLLPLEKLLRIWSEENPDSRKESTKGLMSYLAKGFHNLTRFTDSVTTADCILGLAQQGAGGSLESDFIVTSIGASPAATQLLTDVPALASDLRNINPRYANAFGPSITPQESEKFSYTPGRTFRLIWLDEFISNCILFPGNKLFSEQLDILWPNEKPSTLEYELALTGFDAYASALTLDTRVSIWEQFVVKKLPLILRHLAKGQPLDSALTRLLTTMDKEVAAAVDAKDARLNFTRTCIDLGLCDPSVLHVLHRDYQPRPENLDTILDVPTKEIARKIASQVPETTTYSQALVVKLVDALPDLKPLALEIVSQEIHKLVRNPNTNIRHLAWLSTAFINSIHSCDALSMYVPIKSVLDHLVNRLESLSTSETEKLSPQLYGDIGSILMFVKLLHQRYDIFTTAAEQQSQWAFKQIFQEPSVYAYFDDMTPQVQGLLGNWIKALIGGRGITADCLRPPGEVFEIFPALIKQLALAYEDNVIKQDVLQTAVGCFLQPNLAPCLALIVRIVLYNIWAQLNAKANLEILGFLLAGMEAKSTTPEFKAVINIIAPLFEQFGTYDKTPALKVAIENLVKKSQPVGFSKLEIKGSFVSAFETALKNIVQWQTESIGIPVVDGRLFEMGMKHFGTEEMMRLTIQNVEGSSETTTEVQVAILVIYCSRLVKRVNSTYLIPTGVFSDSITEISREYVNRFHAIYEKHMDVVEEQPIDDEKPDSSIFNMPQEPDVPMITTEPVLEHDATFSYGFDMDPSAPMGLEELDDAMNLDYFQ